MKKGNDDWEVTRPMFPRTHVNDTEKGGPRAPPRNKMALYERFSIPSQKFDPVQLSSKSKKSSSLVPLACTSQGNTADKKLFPPSPSPTSTKFQITDGLHPYHLNAVNFTNRSQLLEQRKKSRDEDEFVVPVSILPINGHLKTHNGMHKKKITTSSLSQSDQSMEDQAFPVGYPNPVISNISSSNGRFRVDLGDNASQNKDVRKKKYVINAGHVLLSREDFGNCKEDATSAQTKGHGSLHCYDCGKIHETRVHTQERDYAGADRCQLVKYGNGGRNSTASKTSTADSLAGLGISPDDVVEIMGRKHFWRARTQIANQQRLFAVQVFELHRLIKVQKLIAGSPHILQQNITYFEKDDSSKDSTEKNIRSESTNNHSQEVPTISGNNGVIQMQNAECPENGLERMNSGRNVEQGNGYPHAAMGLSPATDARPSSWCFHQHPAQQWLIPVMSPSEGLIYKPCTGGLGITGPIPAEFRPVSTFPTMGNPEWNQYFIPCPLPLYNPTLVSAAEQLEKGPNTCSNSNCSMQHYNAKSRSVRRARSPSCDEGELQRTSAANPVGRKNDLALHQMGTAAEQFRDGKQSNHIIRVVPRNPKSATESAVRIFESIQKERRLESL